MQLSALSGSPDEQKLIAWTGRDPEDRPVASDDLWSIREKMLDKTLADSYPASDPPSTIPNPSTDSICLEGPVPVSLTSAA